MKNFLFVLTLFFKLIACVVLLIVAGIVAFPSSMIHLPVFLSWPIAFGLLALCFAMFWPEFKNGPLYAYWGDSVLPFSIGLLVMAGVVVVLSLFRQVTGHADHGGSNLGVGLVAGILAGLFYEFYLRPQKSSFAGGDVRLTLELDALVVTALKNGTLHRDRIPFGHLLFEKDKQTQTRITKHMKGLGLKRKSPRIRVNPKSRSLRSPSPASLKKGGVTRPIIPAMRTPNSSSSATQWAAHWAVGFGRTRVCYCSMRKSFVVSGRPNAKRC
jgi:hypothetical protein